jgi:hypothetical protein
LEGKLLESGCASVLSRSSGDGVLLTTAREGDFDLGRVLAIGTGGAEGEGAGGDALFGLRNINGEVAVRSNLLKGLRVEERNLVQSKADVVGVFASKEIFVVKENRNDSAGSNSFALAFWDTALALSGVSLALSGVSLALSRVSLALSRVSLALSRVSLALSRVSLALAGFRAALALAGFRAALAFSCIRKLWLALDV